MNKTLKFNIEPQSMKESSDPTLRLKHSIAKMVDGINTMRDRNSEFRVNIKELNLEINKLKSSFRDFHSAMGKIDIHPLHSRSLRLAQIMDTCLPPKDEAA